ncbi:porin family protein [Epilithonimonas sp. UC225_85]|uniref:porin family protein n=1 Tax=Epilithonimonas sp. UC225_85 TaxID=3350167 RepID=UPI0036D254D3
MKKLLLVGAIALCGAMNAQVKFGVKAGLALSSLKAEADNVSVSSDSKTSFYVGGLAEYKITDKFALQGELLYSPLGGKETEEENGSLMGYDYSYKYESDYKIGTLLVPISAKYYVTNGLAVGAGFNLGFILSAKNKYSETAVVDGDIESYSEEEDIKKEVNTFNFSPFVSAEYNLNNGLFFDTRYNFGVSNMIKNQVDNETLKMSFFQIGLGYKF